MANALKKIDTSNIDILNSLDSIMAVIHFTPAGIILQANELFLKTVGYSLSEIEGQHHKMFVPAEEVNDISYSRFWKDLQEGKPQKKEFKRLNKKGEVVWLDASYIPLLDTSGKVYQVTKIASDVTKVKLLNASYESQIAAIGKSQAVIEFNLDGTICSANENFLNTLGYTLEEVVGKHHRIFCEKNYAESTEYSNFWRKLGKGEFDSGDYKRIAKDGKEIWIHASYNPILDLNGKPYKVVKFASDITAQKMQNANYEGQIAAISKSQAVIEFSLDGIISYANENFLNTLGYTLDEVIGKHHRIFCEKSYAESIAYSQFWYKLSKGEFDSGDYKRIAKDGKEIWIHASYNPILDLNGKPYKVVKFASDITAQKMQNVNYEGQIEAINKSQAVIEFNMDGTILSANDNFLNTLGYRLSDIQGKHHRMFCDDKYSHSDEYKLFWDKLKSGKFDSGEYTRYDRNGKPVYILASYNPIMDLNGMPFKVVKFATDLTKEKLEKIKMLDALLLPISELATASEYLIKIAEEMSQNALKTSTESEQTSRQAETITNGMQSMSSSIEELTASIKEISHQTVQSSRKSELTSKLAKDTNSTIMKLGKSSEDIGNIIRMISSIAQQTNLLALNATIEAARAGEAGKGFAVVANEVKELAKQTAVATEEITNKIKAIQIESEKSITAIKDIDNSIEDMKGTVSTIATSMEEQSSATVEVSRVVDNSFNYIRHITASIGTVKETAHLTDIGSRQTMQSAKSVGELAAKLRETVEHLKKI